MTAGLKEFDTIFVRDIFESRKKGKYAKDEGP
jgi:hypothetical protein